MKVLLLSCPTGEGHNSAARAVEEALRRAGADSIIVDPISFLGKRAQQLVSGLYNGMIRNVPRTFGAIYKMGEAFSNTGITSPVYFGNAAYAKKLFRYIRNMGFDAVVSTHLYGMEAMTAIRRRISADIPSYGVMTDYTSIPFFTEVELDGYFVPRCGIRETLVEKGISDQSIHETGIPVSARFSNLMARDTARQALQLTDDASVYLIMTGGVGCSNMLGICQWLLKSGNPQDRYFFMTGHNDAMRRQLAERYGTIPQLHAVGYTRDIDLYMSAADVIVTKPGGLSSTEAAVANLPIVHCNAIPGCETQNAAFFSDRGLSLWAKKESDIAAFARSLATDRAASREMCEAQRRWINPNAADDIAKAVIQK